MHEVLRQFFYDSIEHRKRPSPFEDALRCLIVRRLALVTFLAGREFKRQNCPAATFVRALAVFLVGDKKFQRGQDKRPKPALFRVGAIDISAFQDAYEELLREISSSRPQPSPSGLMEFLKAAARWFLAALSQLV
jgi:hypothetical protein